LMEIVSRRIAGRNAELDRDRRALASSPPRGRGGGAAAQKDALGQGAHRGREQRITLFVAFNYGGRAAIPCGPASRPALRRSPRLPCTAPRCHAPTCFLHKRAAPPVENCCGSRPIELVFRESLARFTRSDSRRRSPSFRGGRRRVRRALTGADGASPTHPRGAPTGLGGAPPRRRAGRSARPAAGAPAGRGASASGDDRRAVSTAVPADCGRDRLFMMIAGGLVFTLGLSCSGPCACT